ncbi:MAG: GNAT family N-acetyltransferase [Candidatus Aenigmarchaeota archaeon]|nr:GNAT family N-acetyltransferase [Candidatus Aenigmarchaeota archaeon]
MSVEQIRGDVAKGDFFVADVKSSVVGCASIIEYDGIAELRSLVVHHDYQKRGYSSRLVSKIKEEAENRGYIKLYTLTQTPQIFANYGFVLEDKRPIQKIAKDCVKCPLYDNCIEKTMVVELGKLKETSNNYRGL